MLIYNHIYYFFSGPGFGSSSNRNEYQESSWGRGQRARRPDNLTANCEQII
jgi:hypothetical protein